MARGYSGLDFSTVGAEIVYWLAHTSSLFKGGYSGSGENGNDFAMPTGTPVYAITQGTVVGQGYYGGGGVVSIKERTGRVWYYQHLDQNAATVGQHVGAGELIGYSGGQNKGGHHPSTPEFSSYPHIEVGINAPWGGIWGGGSSVGPNIDPRPFIAALGVAYGRNNVKTGGSGSAGVPSNTSALNAAASTQNQAASNPCVFPASPFDPGAWALYVQCIAKNGLGSTLGPFAIFGEIWAQVGPWFTGFRLLKLGVGVLLVGISLLALILPTAAPIAAAGAAVATGNPELALPAAGVASSIFRKPGTQPAPPPNRGQATAGLISAAANKQPKNQVSVQRSYTTRQLGGQQQAAPPTQPIPAQPAPARTAPSQPISPLPNVLGPNYKPGPTQPIKPAVPTPTAYTTQNAQGKRTLHVPIMAPTTGVPAPGVQRMIPATGPSIPSTPPRARTVRAKPVPAPAAPSTLYAAPVTAPLKGPRTVVTRMPMTPAESQAAKSSLAQSYAGLAPGQSATGSPLGGALAGYGANMSAPNPIQGEPITPAESRKKLEKRADYLSQFLQGANFTPEEESLRISYEDELADIMRQLKGL